MLYKNLFMLISLLNLNTGNGAVNVEKRALVYPQGAVCGILIAIAIPLDLEVFDAFLSHNFETNYGLPQNATDYSLGPNWYRSKRSPTKQEPLFTRHQIYSWIESKIGLLREVQGKPCHCLQRAICEHATSSFAKHNGVFGDIAHVLLSPSTSLIEPDMEAYWEAERQGRETKDCVSYKQLCDFDILQLVSQFDE